MDDIHAPTVASGPTTNGPVNGASKDNLSLQELIQRKSSVEAELLALSEVLDSHGVKMDTPLTTPDGFPRSDIDVAQIRTTRARVIRLKNDYKDLMNRIEKGLHDHHANLQAQAPPVAASQSSTSSLHASNSQASGPAFAKVNSVTSGSPADAAGLKTGDKVVLFGSADWMNHEKLSKVAEVVGQSEGRPIQVVVKRGNSTADTAETLRLSLTPRRNWGGRGMLGCHLVPL